MKLINSSKSEEWSLASCIGSTRHKNDLMQFNMLNVLRFAKHVFTFIKTFRRCNCEVMYTHKTANRKCALNNCVAALMNKQMRFNSIN